MHADMDAPQVDSGDPERLLKTRRMVENRELGRTSIQIREYMVKHGLQEEFDVSELMAEQGVPVAEIDTTSKYEVTEVLARGPMGTVFSASDANIHRIVAMKVMFDSKDDAPEAKEKLIRFINEAQITGQLEHPNIVPLHEFGVDERDNVFFTMKFVRGMHLKQVLEEIRGGNEEIRARFPLDTLLSVFDRVCDAVAFAHAKSVIHRDLKPENIMVGDFGEVLVMDWGLAKVLSRDAVVADGEPGDDLGDDLGDEEPIQLETIRNPRGGTDGFKTVDGAILGTPVFMAPEQAVKHAKVDERADIYALGGILYNMLTLEAPLVSQDLKEMMQAKAEGRITPPKAFNHRGVELAHLPHQRIPESLSAITTKALATRPDARYQTVAELQDDIRAYRAGYATAAEEAGWLRHFALLVRRQRHEFTLTAVFLALVCVVVMVAMNSVIRANEGAQRALIAAARLSEPVVPFERGVGPGEGSAGHGLRELFEARRRVLQELNPRQEKLHFQVGMTSSGLTLDLGENPQLDDIRPLRGLPITKLVLSRTAVMDLSPLRGMPLIYLDISDTSVANISPLAKMPLRHLSLRNTPVRDVSPLKSLQSVEQLVLPRTAQDFDFLRGHLGLRALSFTSWNEPTEDFWREWDRHPRSEDQAQ